LSQAAGSHPFQVTFLRRPLIQRFPYDIDKILTLLDDKQAISVIPSRKHRTVQRKTDWWLFKERHLVECLFNKLKHNRRLATRYDKLTRTFVAFLKLASSIIWLS
jgi:transposase